MQFVTVLTIAMFGYGVFNLVVWAFVTDVIDYHEYLTGLREDGTVYAIYSMARKIGKPLQVVSVVLRLQLLVIKQEHLHNQQKHYQESIHLVH